MGLRQRPVDRRFPVVVGLVDCVNIYETPLLAVDFLDDLTSCLVSFQSETSVYLGCGVRARHEVADVAVRKPVERTGSIWFSAQVCPTRKKRVY